MKRIFFILLLFLSLSLLAQEGNSRPINESVITSLSISSNYLDKRTALEAIQEDSSLPFASNVLSNLAYVRTTGETDHTSLRQQAVEMLCDIGDEVAINTIARLGIIEKNGYVLTSVIACVGKLGTPDDKKSIFAIENGVFIALFGRGDILNENLLLHSLLALEQLSDKGGFTGSSASVVVDIFTRINSTPNISTLVTKKAREVLQKVKIVDRK